MLSASFIPVYVRLLHKDRDEARRVAVAVGAILALAVSVVVLLGVLLAPVLVSVFTPGFSGEKRDATIRLARIFFPGSGLLVLSAWCLGVLNSHGRFFLSYSAPVLWNLAIIGALLAFGDNAGGYGLAQIAALGSVIGSALQFGVQLPAVLALLGGITPSLRRGADAAGTVLRNAVPVFIGRGVVQISSYIDTVIASLLPTGAVAAISYAQVLYTLPVSLFGMSISAAELPAMSAIAGDETERADKLRSRLDGALRQIAFLVIPSAVVFLALGDVVVGALYQTGAFTRDMTVYVWAILAGSAIGLLASTWGRLYASTYYAVQDTRTPLRFAVVRVALTLVMGYVFAMYLPARARAGSEMGRGRNYARLRTGSGGGVSPAAPWARPGVGPDRSSGQVPGQAVGQCPGCGRGRVGSASGCRRPAPSGGGVIFPGYVRCRLLRSGSGSRSATCRAAPGQA